MYNTISPSFRVLVESSLFRGKEPGLDVGDRERVCRLFAGSERLSLGKSSAALHWSGSRLGA